jgi:hypothetical protein
VIRYGTTLPKRIAGNSEISPQNPIIHRAIPILQLAPMAFSRSMRCPEDTAASVRARIAVVLMGAPTAQRW